MEEPLVKNDIKHNSTLRFPGFDSGIPDSAFDKFNIPSTSLIGRYFRSSDCSVLGILNPFYNAVEKKNLEISVAEMLFQRDGKLDILNAACGGCADIPLLYLLLEELLPNGADIKIENCDASSEVARAVASGEHYHFRMSDIDNRSFGGETLKEKVLNYIDDYFCENGIINFEANTSEQRLFRNFKMIESAQDLISSPRVSSITSLEYEDQSQSIVLCFNLACYLSERDKKDALLEVLRVLKPGGIFLTDGAIYQKQGERLSLISGCTINGSYLNKGIFPTTEYFRPNGPPFLRRFNMLSYNKSLSSDPDERNLGILIETFSPKYEDMFIPDKTDFTNPSIFQIVK